MTATTVTSSKPKWQVIAMYVVILLLNVGIGFSGVQKLLGAEIWVEQFNNFGYPLWFMYLIGVLQVAGAIMLWLPKTRLLAAGMFIVIMAGAAFSNLMVGAVGYTAPNIVLILLSGVVAWLSRDGWPLSQFLPKRA